MKRIIAIAVTLAGLLFSVGCQPEAEHKALPVTPPPIKVDHNMVVCDDGHVCKKCPADLPAVGYDWRHNWTDLDYRIVEMEQGGLAASSMRVCALRRRLPEPSSQG